MGEASQGFYPSRRARCPVIDRQFARFLTGLGAQIYL
jgi:hypothetical protein